MDWVKYMNAAYPPPDEIDNDLIESLVEFMEDSVKPMIISKTDECGEIEIIKENASLHNFDSILLVSGDAESLAGILNSNWGGLNNLVTQYNQLSKNGKAPLVDEIIISVQSANFYWQPKPPVILFSGLMNDKTDADILKKAGNNQFTVLKSDVSLPDSGSDFEMMSRFLNNNIEDFNILLSAQATNPFILEWDMMLTDTKLLRDDNGQIHPNALLDSIQIKQHGADFKKSNTLS